MIKIKKKKKYQETERSCAATAAIFIYHYYYYHDIKGPTNFLTWSYFIFKEKDIKFIIIIQSV